MGVRDCLTDLCEYRDQGRAIRGFSRKQIGERVALDELHREERPAIRQRADVVNRRNRGMLELTGDARFVEKAPGAGRTDGEASLEELQSDIAVEGDLPRSVDDAHAARTDLFE